MNVIDMIDELAASFESGGMQAVPGVTESLTVAGGDVQVNNPQNLILSLLGISQDLAERVKVLQEKLGVK